MTFAGGMLEAPALVGSGTCLGHEGQLAVSTFLPPAIMTAV